MFDTLKGLVPVTHWIPICEKNWLRKALEIKQSKINKMLPKPLTPLQYLGNRYVCCYSDESADWGFLMNYEQVTHALLSAYVIS